MRIKKPKISFPLTTIQNLTTEVHASFTQQVKKGFKIIGPIFTLVYAKGEVEIVHRDSVPLFGILPDEISKDAMVAVAKALCEDPHVLSCSVSSDAWASKPDPDKPIRPSQDPNRQSILLTVTELRDAKNNVTMYALKSDHEGKVFKKPEVFGEGTTMSGRLCNILRDGIKQGKEKSEASKAPNN